MNAKTLLVHAFLTVVISSCLLSGYDWYSGLQADQRDEALMNYVDTYHPDVVNEWAVICETPDGDLFKATYISTYRQSHQYEVGLCESVNASINDVALEGI